MKTEHELCAEAGGYRPTDAEAKKHARDAANIFKPINDAARKQMEDAAKVFNPLYEVRKVSEYESDRARIRRETATACLQGLLAAGGKWLHNDRPIASDVALIDTAIAFADRLIASLAEQEAAK